MVLGRVVGTVVSSRKEARMEGIKLLLVEKISFSGKKIRGGDTVVAMDAVGAGVGEIVMYVAGSSSRMTKVTDGKPSDATITAIVDLVDLDGKTVYNKEQA